MRRALRIFVVVAVAALSLALPDFCTAPAAAAPPGTAARMTAAQPTTPTAAPAPGMPAEQAVPDPSTWSFAASLYAYVLPDDDSFLLPVVYADRDWLHLEARYNYEAMDSASLWGGWCFATGSTVTLEAIPMLGFVFGDTSGIAPGLEFSLGWRQFELYSESEYVFDLDDSEANFFYAWSELTYAPKDWLAFGLAAQRTRAYETDVDVQRGLLLELSRGPGSLRGYLFNFDRDEAFGIIAAGWEF